VENHVCLSRGVQVAGAAWRAMMRIVTRVGHLVRRTRDSQAQVEYLVPGWSGGHVTQCAVCTMHVETRSVDFLVEPQNQGRLFISGLASKPLGQFLPVWPQNHWWQFLLVWPKNQWWSVSCFGPQNWQLRFSNLGLKITATVFGLGLRTKQASVCRLRHKTDRRMKTTRGTRRDLAA
jgi:hypothetical protein